VPGVFGNRFNLLQKLAADGASLDVSVVFDVSSRSEKFSDLALNPFAGQLAPIVGHGFPRYIESNKVASNIEWPELRKESFADDTRLGKRIWL